MAIEEARRFMSDVDCDASLRDKVRGSLEHIYQVARDHGYDFSDHELRQHLREKWGVKDAPNYDQSSDTCFFA